MSENNIEHLVQNVAKLEVVLTGLTDITQEGVVQDLLDTAPTELRKARRALEITQDTAAFTRKVREISTRLHWGLEFMGPNESDIFKVADDLINTVGRREAHE